MRVRRRTYTVIGVGPADFEGAVRRVTPAFYAANAMVDELNRSPMLDGRGHRTILARACLRPGVTLSRPITAVGVLAARLTSDRMADWDPRGQFALLPLTEMLLHPTMDAVVRAAAWMLMAVVGLVLLLDCTNLPASCWRAPWTGERSPSSDSVFQIPGFRAPLSATYAARGGAAESGLRSSPGA